MREHEQYISGPHSFWSHFCFGLVVGSVVSTLIGLSFFETMPGIVISIAIGTPIVAFCFGRWGDSAWYWLIKRLPWLS